MCNLQISDAKSCDDLYKIVGEDFWLATWCNSAAFEGYALYRLSLSGFYFNLPRLKSFIYFSKQLEGTRITLVKT